MILPEFILGTWANALLYELATDSFEKCVNKKHFLQYPHDVVYKHNSRGFRDNEWPNDLNALQSSVWCIGDSFTVGVGSPIEHTWPYILGKNLSRSYINVSMPGASNSWIARKAVNVINVVRPDILAIQWSFLRRTESSDTSLSDEDRRVPYSNMSIEEDCLRFFKNFALVENKKEKTRVLHSMVPIDTNFSAEYKTLHQFNRVQKIHEVKQIDFARDFRHYDKLTSEKLVKTLIQTS